MKCSFLELFLLSLLGFICAQNSSSLYTTVMTNNTASNSTWSANNDTTTNTTSSNSTSSTVTNGMSTQTPTTTTVTTVLMTTAKPTTSGPATVMVTNKGHSHTFTSVTLLLALLGLLAL